MTEKSDIEPFYKNITNHSVERTTADKDDACDVSEDHTVIANSSRLGYHCDRLLFDRQNCWEESHKSYSYRFLQPG